MGQLNELQIKAAHPRDKEYLLADGEGLYLRVRPTAKAWVYRYKQGGKESKLSLGWPLPGGVAVHGAQESPAWKAKRGPRA